MLWGLMSYTTGQVSLGWGIVFIMIYQMSHLIFYNICYLFLVTYLRFFIEVVSMKYNSDQVRIQIFLEKKEKMVKSFALFFSFRTECAFKTDFNDVKQMVMKYISFEFNST